MTEQWLADLIGPLLFDGRDLGPGIARVLWLRYCLPDRQTLRAIGGHVGTTPENVRQREARGLRVLRHRSRRAAFVEHVPRDHRLAAAVFGEPDEVERAYAQVPVPPEPEPTE